MSGKSSADRERKKENKRTRNQVRRHEYKKLALAPAGMPQQRASNTHFDANWAREFQTIHARQR